MPRRRRGSRSQTHRQAAAAACAAHLRDLKRIHRRPPADVAVERVAVPARIAPVETSSSCVSPAALCAELAP